MSWIGEIAGRLRRSEDGYTLIELLVAATMGMVVLGGGLTVFIGAVRSEPRVNSQVSAVQEGRIASERITRELRQGLEVVPAGESGLSLLTYVPAGTCAVPGAGKTEPCRLTYACAAGECTRTAAQPDGSPTSASVRVVSGLASDDVFTYSPSSGGDPEYVGVEFSFATQEGGPVVVADGATLRNGGS